MSESHDSEGHKLEKVFRFDKFALLLGFIVDSITLGSILLALQSGVNLYTGLITPTLAIVVWSLAAYIYFAYLHHYWEGNQEARYLADSFGVFLVYDLIFTFRFPLLLFPGVILFIFMVWIAFVADKSYFLAVPLGFGLIFGIAWLFAARDTFADQVSNSRSKRRVDQNWTELKMGIKGKLSKYQWVGANDFSEWEEVWHISQESVKYALARYALENPAQTEYARVYSIETNKPVVLDRVLINLQNFRNDKYYSL